ncbi:hypothetical protein GTA62_03890 [Roseobacter sp. HKCCD9010]|nr:MULTISPECIES: Rap1a/Tai family immunity protein [unclassified Roseobacter]MBF9048991.1 hypothetical protein [Rhodobacterales bacterium HKCCD4356]NNV37415.1 hypothetical protein [Roseobacter sp. HKCCD9054]NNV75868.1 hypothetical protein [Roseobacter sp. HKCCD6135]NNW22569.1 hypothetical protein [Roseobacter sp. HKCCD5929]NNW90763.1 hypothetical protein [Roseobacter sp. HKCCD9063]NNX84501.1 hypothetical protein [Roseobacter sp. HKCCD8809]NNY74320.1 hypothetical protein [Roseobacter sp. HKCC
MNARTLLDACTRVDIDWVNFCNGFMQAAHDQAVGLGLICVPSGTTRLELVETFDVLASRLIALEPTLGEEAGMDVAIIVLSDAYPCN